MKEVNLGKLYTVYSDGKVFGHRYKKFLKKRIGRGGYYQVHLQHFGGGQYLHRLLAKLFIPNPENKPQVNHIDGNKLNNSLDNLEWVTCKENINHATKIGLSRKRKTGEWKSPRKGNSHHNRRISEEIVKEAKELYATGKYSYRELGEKYGVHLSTIAYAINGTWWKCTKED